MKQRAEILQAGRAELTGRIIAAQHALQLIDSALSCQYEDFTQCQRYQNAINSLADHARNNDD